MNGPGPAIVAVEGVIGGAVITMAKAIAAADRGQTAGVSAWDASGVFSEVAVTEEIAGRPSARTLLLLYATDLAFRLRADIQPALDAGQAIIVAPYVETAIAFGRAAGIDTRWIADIFRFAPMPSATHYASPLAASSSERQGFVEFVSRQVVAPGAEPAARALMKDTDRHLRALLRHARTRSRDALYGDVAT